MQSIVAMLCQILNEKVFSVTISSDITIMSYYSEASYDWCPYDEDNLIS